MTDLEKLKALLTEFGVGFEVSIWDDEINVSCSQGNAKIDGYIGFCTIFRFKQSDESFIAVGAWE